MIRSSSRASPRRARFPSRTLLFFSSLYLLSLSRTHSRNTCSVHAHHPRRCLFLHAPAPFLSRWCSQIESQSKVSNFSFKTYGSHTRERSCFTFSPSRPAPRLHRHSPSNLPFPSLFFFPSPLTACPYNTSSSGVLQLQDHTARVHDPSTH